ncbi:Ger(x)C family spore germination protein [Bacillus benzoevorans]|uniref:Spore germination protein KC n=2 Tax=Bacillus benzoevorans TaxID=1456 RepID=A0A7X0LVH6_9BACI|nr:spore germination protein KC [Bacillus benzoevorans]
MKRRIMLLFSAAMSLLCLTGCWDRVEVNDLAIVTGTAIDKKGEEIELSIQIFIPKAASTSGDQSGSGGGENITVTTSQTGVNLADALSKLQGKLSRQVFWGQCKIFIFSKDLAKDGIQDQMDFILRHPEPRERAFVYISEGKAKDILEVVPRLERYSSEVLREVSNKLIGMQVTIQDVDEMLTDITGSVAIPYVKIKSEKPLEGKETMFPHIDGTAIFHRDKMIGTINESETRGILWLRDEIKGYTVSVELAGERGLVSLNPVSAHISLKPKIEKGTWIMIVEVITESSIVENETKIEFTDPKQLKRLERKFGKAIETRIREVLVRLQEDYHADIIGFSKVFYNKYPKEWKQVKNHWDEAFANVRVDINVEAHIRREGSINKPGAMPKEEVKNK